jgi:hypothetical protein
LKKISGAIEKFKSFLPSNNDIGSQDIKQLIRKEKSILSRGFGKNRI